MDLLVGMALSYHLGFENEYNSIHPHIRLQHEHFITGVYYNSESNASAYAGVEYNLNNFFVEGGAVTGYTTAPVVPFARMGYKFNDISVFIAPGEETINGTTEIHPVLGIELMKKVF